MIESYLHHEPVIHPEAFVHTMAYVGGDVRIGARASIWPTTVLRGDQGAIDVGEDSSVQDGTVVHATGGQSTTFIGRRVTIGHRAVIHGCRIEDDCLVGMGAIILDNAVIGAGSLVGAGAVVTARTIIPPGSLVLGSPARVKGPVTTAHTEWIEHSWKTYCRLGREHRPR
jgi:carbonic anhydrase/acetyltransferase-like protein (isoleucine patch superfamily)